MQALFNVQLQSTTQLGIPAAFTNMDVSIKNKF